MTIYVAGQIPNYGRSALIVLPMAFSLTEASSVSLTRGTVFYLSVSELLTCGASESHVCGIPVHMKLNVIFSCSSASCWFNCGISQKNLDGREEYFLSDDGMSLCHLSSKSNAQHKAWCIVTLTAVCKMN